MSTKNITWLSKDLWSIKCIWVKKTDSHTCCCESFLSMRPSSQLTENRWEIHQRLSNIRTKTKVKRWIFYQLPWSKTFKEILNNCSVVIWKSIFQTSEITKTQTVMKCNFWRENSNWIIFDSFQILWNW